MVRKRLWQVFATALSCCAAYDVAAVDQVIVEAGAISLPGVQLTAANMTLDVSGGTALSAPTPRVPCSNALVN